MAFQVFCGPPAAPADALLAINDPGNFDVRGGLACTTTYGYDDNGNLVETSDGDDSDLSSANNSALGRSSTTGTHATNSACEPAPRACPTKSATASTPPA